MRLSDEHAEKLEDLLSSKNFEDLTSKEKAFVLEHMTSKDEYEKLRMLSISMSPVNHSLTPLPETIEELQKRIKTKPDAEPWYLYLFRPVPAYAYAITVILFLLVYVWLPRRERLPEVQIKTVMRIDTVYVAAKADTVFIDKVKVIYTTQTQEPKTSSDFSLVERAEQGQGVSMKEKQELELLLVSGS